MHPPPSCSTLKSRGYVLFQGLWDIQKEAIIDVIFGYADVGTYKKEEKNTLLPRWWKINKEKHGRHCHEQRKNYPLFVLSVDGIIGKEEQVVIATLS